MALETELAVYQAKLAELQANVGKYVLIHGEDVIDTFGSYEDALKAGYAQFGLNPFLVKRIQAVESSLFISRYIKPTRATA